MSRLIDADALLNELWKSLYKYEDETEKKYLESDELDIGDWIQHRIFVQNMSDIDRQTAIEELKSYIVDPKDVISENPDDVFQYNSGIRTAVGVIMELPTASPWHRVEDELPTEKGPYITAYYDGYVGENVWHFIGETAVGWMYDADAVRYWMTMPEPPKEET